MLDFILENVKCKIKYKIYECTYLGIKYCFLTSFIYLNI